MPAESQAAYRGSQKLFRAAMKSWGWKRLAMKRFRWVPGGNKSQPRLRPAMSGSKITSHVGDLRLFLWRPPTPAAV